MTGPRPKWRAAVGGARGRRRTLLLACVLTALAGCAPDPAAAPATAPPARVAQTTVPATAPPGYTVRAGLTEWSIEFSDEVFPAGTLRVAVVNAGATGHDLVIRGREGVWATPVLAPGETAELEITTVAGETLQTVCTVAGHHSAGMHLMVEVVST